MRRLPLSDLHSRLGAVFFPFEGWEIPRHYGDPLKEYDALRTGAGLCDRSYRGIIRIAGRDRQEFLHSMVSNDVKGLRAGQGTYAALLTPKGKMIADLWIYVLPEFCLVATEPSATAELTQALQKYTLAADVTIEDRTDEHGTISLLGPRSTALVRAVLSSPPADPAGLSHKNVEFHGSPVLLARTSSAGEEGFDLLAPTEILEPLWLALSQEETRPPVLPVGWTALELLRVEAGVPRFGQDMDHDAIPLEAGIESRAISLTKGCYMGQEIIARIVHRGHVNRRLVGLKLAPGCSPGKGEPILGEGGPVGEITTALLSPRFGPIALGYVRRDLAEPGRSVSVGGRSAQIVELPFHRRPPGGQSG